MITPERLQQMAARAEKATEGPWDCLPGSMVRAIRVDLAVPLFDVRLPIMAHLKKRQTAAVVGKASRDEVNNCHFVAHARSDIPDLLAEVARLTDALEKAEKEKRTMEQACARSGAESLAIANAREDWRLRAEAAESRLREMEAALREVDGCFEAALCEGWTDALANGDMDTLRDLYSRRIEYARHAAVAALSSPAKKEE